MELSKYEGGKRFNYQSFFYDMQMKDSIGLKFRQINKRLIESLITGEVSFSSPENLNDPFDCQIDIKKGYRLKPGHFFEPGHSFLMKELDI